VSHHRLISWGLTGLLALCVNAHAASITPVSVSAAGSFNGALTNLTDGVYPLDYSLWNAPGNVSWAGTATSIVFDLGQAYTLTDITLAVDNNDYYFLQVSNDGAQWNALTTVLAFDGPVSSGMDTFSSQSQSPDYSALIDFQPQGARYVRLSAVAGDGLYSAGEVSFQGTPAVPEPEAVALTLVGAGVAMLAARRRRKS
jgi:F5/8 type C domain